MIESSCHPFHYTELHCEFRAGDDDNNGDGGGFKFVVQDVVQCHDVLFVICSLRRTGCSVIYRYNATTHKRLTDIFDFDEILREPIGLAACKQTAHVYVLEISDKCILQVSEDDTDIRGWLCWTSNDAFEPCTVLVTAGRLLVTSYDIYMYNTANFNTHVQSQCH